MPTRHATARWDGNLKEGKGTMRLPSQGFEGPYTRASRFEEGEGTNPEELVGAAHAGCFTMFLSGVLAKAGHEPNYLETDAAVTVEVTDDGPAITRIELTVEGDVPGVEDADFQDAVAESKANCPVSKALAGVREIEVKATLL